MPSLRTILTIFRRELRSYFNSPWLRCHRRLSGHRGLVLQLEPLPDERGVHAGGVRAVPLVFLFFIPAITMRLLAEEQEDGNPRAAHDAAVRDFRNRARKFLAAWVLVAITLLPNIALCHRPRLPRPADIGPVVSGYLGLLLMAAVYVASACSPQASRRTRLVAFITGFLAISRSSC